MNAAEHFDWALERAYAELDDPRHADGIDAAVIATSSIQSDLDKHPGTRRLVDGQWRGMASLTSVQQGREGTRRILDQLRSRRPR